MTDQHEATVHPADPEDPLTDTERADLLGLELDAGITDPTLEPHEVAALAVAYAVTRRVERAAPTPPAPPDAPSPARVAALELVANQAALVIRELKASGVDRTYFEGRLKPFADAIVGLDVELAGAGGFDLSASA